MLTYLMIFIFSVSLALLSDKVNSKKQKKFLRFLSFLILFLFSALRYDVGYDYSYTYLPGYYRIISGQNIYFEFLFLIMNKVVYVLFNNPDWLFIISSFITLSLVYKNSEDDNSFYLFTILLFASRFYFYSFSQVRQYIAIAIFLYSIKYIINKNPKKYFLCCLFAIGFHKTAILYLPIYFVNKIKLTKKQYLTIMLICPILKPIFAYIYKVVGSALYSGYIASGFGAGNYSIVLTATGIIFSIIPLLVYNKIKENEGDKGNILLNLQLILWIFVMDLNFINESYRIVGMFMYSSLYLLPIATKYYSKKTKWLISILLISISFYSSYLSLVYPNGKMLPYKTIFNK